ncbi:MAG: GDP-mannose 4,6-dehydratase [Candidatus Beckwithbacteria bacterium]
MVILVTGNAGFIGSNLTAKLLDLGHRVVGVDNFNDYYDPRVKEKNLAEFKNNSKFTQLKLDILESDKLEAVFREYKPEVVIHLAARAGIRPSLSNPELYRQVNVEGTKNLLKLSQKYQVKQFIFASSSSVYGNQEKTPFSETDKLDKPVSPYAKTKLEAEKLCINYDLPMTILRFFTVYGAKGRPDMAPYLFTKQILNNQPIIKYGDGSSSRDYTYIDDIVEGIVKAIKNPFKFEIINLGNNQPVSLNEFIRIVEELSGKKAVIKQQPRHPADVRQTYADIAKAKKLLNWQPKTDLETGMKRFIEWYKLNQKV